MPIRIVTNEGNTSVEMICDHCDQQIRNAADCNIGWRAIDIADAYFVHKACARAYERNLPYTTNFMDPERFLGLLAQGLNIALVAKQDRL
jgi:hypothetical protein